MARRARADQAQKPLGLFGGGKPIRVRIGGRKVTLVAPNRKLARAIEKVQRPEPPPNRREDRKDAGSP